MSNGEKDASITARTVQMKQPFIINEESRAANHSRSVTIFMRDLHVLWVRSGRLDAWSMAERVGAPAARFEFLFRSPEELPDFEDVLALLMAVRERPEVIRRWQRRWERLSNCNPLPAVTDAIQPLVIIKSGGQSQGNEVGTDADSPLGRALLAETPEEFVEQLRTLKKRASLSFEAIGNATNGQLPRATAHWMLQSGNFPARPEQVILFVGACGADKNETELWLTAYTRAQGKKRIRATMAKSSKIGESHDTSVALEDIGDELATIGQYNEAIDFYKEALAQLRYVLSTKTHAQRAGEW